MNKKPKHFDELCRQIGIAVLLGQIVESMLARYIAVKLRLEAAAAVHQVQEALAAADSKPLGALIKHIKKNCPFPKLLTDQLELFRDERNWLIHRLNREHEMATFREDASLPVFSRINKYAQLSMTIMQALHNIGNTIMTKHGLDDKAINTNAIREFMRNISEP